MASQNGSITTNEIYGRSITLNWSIASQSSATNKTVINYSIVGSGSLSGDYYVISGPITVNINGTNVYAETGRIAVYKQTLKSGTLEISHNNDGSKTFSASISAAIYDSSINASASGSWELPTIPRYATCQQSLASKTETSITMNWSSDNTIDYVWYSKDGGSTWVAVGSVNATSGSYTISGLSANTTYSIKTRVRRKDSGLTTDSTATSITTYRKVTQSLSSKTVNSITMSWSLDTEADYIWYSIGSGWVAVGSVNAKSGSYTITGLSPNTTYNVYVKARRKSTQTTSDTLGSPVAVKTYKIPKITSSPDMLVIGNNATIQFDDNESRATISACVCNTAGQIIYAPYRSIGNAGSGNYTFQFATEEINNLYNAIPNDPKGNLMYVIRITVNGTNYYSTSVKEMKVNESICKPIFSDFYYEDTDANVVALTGTNQILVNKISDPTIVVWEEDKAVARNGASMSKYRVKIGNQTFEKAYSATGAEYLKVFTDITSPIIEVSAIDSRGLETKVTKTATWKDYWNSKIETYKAERENGIGTKILIDVRGKFWAGNFGNTQNSVISIVYRYKEKGASSYSSGINITDSFTFDNTNGTFVSNSGAFLPSTNNGTTPVEFEVGKEYDIQFSVYDQAYQSTGGATVTLRTNSGIPGRDLYKDSNGNYHEGINQLADPNYALAIGGNTKIKGKLVVESGFGFEMGQLPRYTGDLNDLNTTTMVYCNSATNAPSGAGNGYCVHFVYASTYMRQIYYSATVSSYVYTRIKNNGTWGAWRQIDNIVGYGSNANGSYLQFSDGTMICWYSYRVTASNSYFQTAYGSIWHNGATTWTFPVKFTGVPKIIATAYLRGGIGGFNITTVPNDTAIAGYEYSFAKYDFGAGNAGVDFIAIGRWK